MHSRDPAEENPVDGRAAGSADLDGLAQCFIEGPVVDVDGYPYFVNPLADGVPRVDPVLLGDAAEGLRKLAGDGYGIILAPEAMGIPIGAALSLRTGIPFSIVRKRRYGLPGETAVEQSTGYSRSAMYINGVQAGDRVLVVDDVIDTGGTVGCIVRALRSIGAEVVCVAAVYDRSRDLDGISADLGVPVRALLRVGVTDGRPVVLRRRDSRATYYLIPAQQGTPWIRSSWRRASPCLWQAACWAYSAASSPGFM